MSWGRPDGPSPGGAGEMSMNRRRETENTKSKGDLKHGIDRSNERGNFRAEGTHGGIEYSGQQCGQCKYLWL